MAIRSPSEFIREFLINQSSSRSQTVDASVTPMQFEYEVPVGKSMILTHMCIRILDVAMAMNKFGGQAALDNGVSLQILDTDNSTVLLDMTAGLQVKNNSQFGSIARLNFISSPADDALFVEFRSNAGCLARLEEGQFVAAIVRDDLSGIMEMDAMIEGIQYDKDHPDTLIRSLNA